MNEQLIGDLFATAMGRMTGSTSREFSQKFAELIVRECANVAADHDALDIYEEIREHFGVEE